MTYSLELNKNVNHKIVIFEYDLPVLITEFINYESGIFYKQFYKSRNIPEGALFPQAYYNDNIDNEEYTNIGSLSVDNTDYTKVFNLADLRTQNESFYFNYAEQRLYIHFDNMTWHFGETVRMGSVQGLIDNIDMERPDGAYYNDIYYEPRITKLPTLNSAKDPLFWGLLSYKGLSINIENADGAYDNFTELDVFGQSARWKLGFSGIEYSEFVTVKTGYITNPKWDNYSLTLNMQDPRDRLSADIATNKLDKATYPNLSDDNVGESKPVCYGVVRSAKSICLDELASSPTNNTFLIADTEFNAISALTKVYRKVDNDTQDITASVVSSDLSEGTFLLPHSTVFDGDSLYEITIDFTGSTIENGFDVMQDIYENYGEIQFLSSNYNIDEWNDEKTGASDVGIYLGKPTTIKKAFEEITKSIQSFWLIQDDGLISNRIFNENRTIKKRIENDEWENEPKFSKPEKEYLSSSTCEYDKKQDANSYRKYENLDYSVEAQRKYKVQKSKSFKTLLTNKTDATKFTQNILDRSANVQTTVKRRTLLKHIDLQIMDFIECSHDRSEKEFNVYEVIGKVVNLELGTIDLIMKYVKEAVEITEHVLTLDALYGSLDTEYYEISK